MFVCKDCLNAIVSRGEKVFNREIDMHEMDDGIIETDEDGNIEECLKCEWCDEIIPVSDCVEVL